MTNFLDHKAIKNRLVTLLSAKEPLRIAVAYWGTRALELLNLDPRRSDFQVLCCLKAGSSDPAIIARFGERARQIDNLHAKVFWTPSGAIVGSANASANGLPEQESVAGSLIEAGVYLDDKDELIRIKQWFDELYAKEAKVITANDLERAAQERAARLGKRVSKRPFLAALANNPSEFSQQRIAFYLYKEFCSHEEEKAVKMDVDRNPDEMEKMYGVSDPKRFDFYTFCRKPPSGYFEPDTILIEGLYADGKISKRHFYIRQTFNDVRQRTIVVMGETEWWMPVLENDYIHGFNYVLADIDKKIISDAAEELWKAGRKGVQDDCLISLADARQILLRHYA